MGIKRIVCWFSCGVTSAVATKLTLDKYKNSGIPIVIAYCDTGSEHKDNKRFLVDCEKWYGYSITILRNPKFNDIYEVFAETNYIAGIQGATCSYYLKKQVRRAFEDLSTDLQIFGYDSAEKKRAERFIVNNPEVTVEFPLIEHGWSKPDCLILVQSVGIEIPIMYKMGYKNNNCIGCVKGGVGYWNKIKRDYPEIFERTARISREYGTTLVKHRGKRIFLDEIEPSWGNYKSELPIECGLFCGTDGQRDNVE